MLTNMRWLSALLVAGLAAGCVGGKPDDRPPPASFDDDPEEEPNPIPSQPTIRLPDEDDDGFTQAVDCDDAQAEVNPGAFEHADDGVDNDCDGEIDEPTPCDDTPLDLDSTDAMDFARALGLCETANDYSDPDDRKWGVLSARFRRVDGERGVAAVQHGILREFGPNSPARAGENLVVLSSGSARLPEHEDHRDPLLGYWITTDSAEPPQGHPKTSPDCPALDVDPGDGGFLYDTIALVLRIRTPTNAQAFSFQFSFFTSEYSQYVCSPFNDAFVALLKSNVEIPSDQNGNISFDARGNPVSVNNGFFEYCVPSSGKLDFPCAGGTELLAGTGFEPTTDVVTGETNQNGATGWLRTESPIDSGEIIEIRFIIWDATDGVLDSTVLLDDWQWHTTPASEPVTRRPEPEPH